MNANPKKNEFMVIGHPLMTNKITVLVKLEMNGPEIKRARKVKSLGLIVDEKLSWSDHFKLLKGKISAGLSSMKQLKNILSQSQLCSVYRALMESHIRYADVTWGNFPRPKVQTQQRFQD